MKLWKKILIGLVLGVVCGLLLGQESIYLKPIGALFLNLINMIIPLLVLSSMAVGVTSIHDPKKMGRVGIKTLVLYVGTTIIAITIGMAFAALIQPGLGLEFVHETVSIQTPTTPTIGEIFKSMVPSNPFVSLVEGNVLQIIVFALFLGLATSFAGEKGKPFLRILESTAEVMYSLTGIVIQFSPIGVFAIMAWVTGSFGLSVLLPLSKFLFSFYLACALHVLIVFCGILWLVKVNPVVFFRGMTEAILMAFSTCSSSATLPVSMACVQDNLGVSKNISGFMLPLGATINMNGTAIFQASAALFIAQAYSIDLTFTQLSTIVLTATLSAIGTAGIPGAGMIMLAAVINSVGLPLEGVIILASVDRIREMGATTLNILGDAVCAMYVAKTEGELDRNKFEQFALQQTTTL